MDTKWSLVLHAGLTAMVMGGMLQTAWAGWWPWRGGASTAPEPIKVWIIHPEDGDLDMLGPISNDVQLKLVGQVTNGERDVTDRVESFKWTLVHEWHSQRHTYSAAEKTAEGPENPRWVTVDWQYGAYPEGTGDCEGRIKVFLKARLKGKWYSATKHAVQLVGGTNPPHETISNYLPSDRLRAVGWAESEYHQFIGSGAPYRTSFAWGLMQLNESPAAWGNDSRFNWRALAWHCQHNAEMGTWLHDTYLPCQLTPLQQRWTPQQRRDACTYGYNQGEGKMKRASWETVDSFGYVEDVRTYEDTKPW